MDENQIVEANNKESKGVRERNYLQIENFSGEKKKRTSGPK